MTQATDIGAVIIGRNEGERLIRCLASCTDAVGPVVYVDSGSTDGSQDAARRAGAECLALDTDTPFTAARARNAGLDRLSELHPDLTYVQFVDGDCELRDGWVAAARSFLETRTDVAVVCGRRRERFPGTSLYNRLIDKEWDTPVGEAKACGGDALMRISALRRVGGYDATLIAGEEPELCVRLRQAGWYIWRLDAEMTWHDAQMARFGQWWRRARRAGHAYAEGMAMHGAPPERHKVDATLRAVIWGLVLPGLALLGAFVLSPWLLLLLLALPVQALRLGLRTGDMVEGVFLTLSKLPEAAGVLTYVWRRMWRRQGQLIEYK